MKVGIYANIKKDKNLDITKKIIELFRSESMNFVVYKDVAENFNNVKSFDFTDKMRPDVMVTIGGDGTILGIAEYCANNRIPILGVNLGKLGFLTEIEISNLSEIANVLKNGNYNVEKRTMLSAEVNGKKVSALNEIVVKRENDGRMVSLDVFVNGGFLDNYYCDGYIVATPTGSTAYSLSAGGSIISPIANVFALTPISSHSLHSRPVVISDTEKIVLSLKGDGNAAAVVADGKICETIGCAQEIHIKKSNTQALFVRIKENNFYLKLLSKLNTWSVTGGRE